MPDFYANKGPVPVQPAAAGSTQADANALTAGVLNVVSGADGTKGMKLPVAVGGDTLTVYSSAATNALKVYPQTGGSVMPGAANAAYSQTAQKLARYICVDGSNWVVELGN